MNRVIVRYRVEPDRVEENLELVRAVYAELKETQPDGFRYSTFQLEDDVTFVHVAVVEGTENPLPTLEAFKRFQAGIADRCEEKPVALSANTVGSFGSSEADQS
jgi:hypothetical protein